MQRGGEFGAPFLQIKIPEEWENDNFVGDAKVSNHEGRNRMYALMELDGDIPVEVHLFPMGGLRARHLTSEIMKQLNKRMVPQGKTSTISGPFFSY